MSNPLLEDLHQTRPEGSLTLALPTLGRFYEEGVLDPSADPAEVDIFPLGIASELHMNDPLLVASGRTIPRLVRAVCPAVVDPDRLCGIDMDAILLASRILSQGPKMRMKVTCANSDPVHFEGENEPRICAHEDEIEADLQEVMFRYQPIEDSDLGSYVVDLPALKQKVCVQPPTYRSSVEIIRASVNTESVVAMMGKMTVFDFVKDEDKIRRYEAVIEENVKYSVASLADHIFYVETSSGTRVADKEAITEWLLLLDKEHLKPVRDRLAKLTEAISELSTSTYECSACKYQNKVQITLDPQKLFFYEEEGFAITPPSRSTSNQKGNTRRRSSKTSQR